MAHDTLDHVLTLNNQLGALANAGVPVDVGHERAGEPIATTLQRLGASVALRAGRGQSIGTAIADNPDLPRGYRCAVQAGLRSNYPPLALEGLCGQVEATADLRTSIGRLLVAPIVVFSLAYFGVILLCLLVTPTIEGIYAQLGKEPDPSIRLLVAARETMVYWAPLPPLLMAGIFWLWRRVGQATGCSATGGWGTFRRTRRYLSSVRYAHFAELLATMVERDVPFPDGLRLASDMIGDELMIKAAECLAAGAERGDSTDPQQHDLRGLPPLLRWTLTSARDSQSLAPMLRFAAETYRRTAARQADLWQVAVPAIATLLLAGPVVLAYGLSLFVPLVDLLETLAQP
jgi:general secretion pathway protein F